MIGINGRFMQVQSPIAAGDAFWQVRDSMVRALAARLFGLALAMASVGCGGAHTGVDGRDGGADGVAAPREVDGNAVDGSAVDGPEMASRCEFHVSAQPSPAIPTVGIVTWSTSLASPRSARIEFGLTEAYGRVAPVHLQPTEQRTLLLGMKPMRSYHFRIVASDEVGDCVSGDFVLATGALANGLPNITVMDKSDASPLFGGFFIAGQYLPIPTGGMPAYIVDQDGELVWAYLMSRDVTGVHMSYDGQFLWLNAANVPSSQGAVVHRVSMDGLVDDDLSQQFVGMNHQLTVLPDETVAFYAYGANGCEDIKEYSPRTRAVRTLVNAGVAQGRDGNCHLTNIQYSPMDDTLVFSDLYSQAVTKIRRSDGTTVWIMGGVHSTIAGVPWLGDQHSLHILGVDRLLLFNNNTRTVTEGPPGTGDGSIVMELALDPSSHSVAMVWSYKADPGVQNDVMGDVQRLPNGNTLVAFSTKGVVQEVDAAGVLLQEWTWPLGASLGYVEKRATLYGPPPR